MKTIIKRVILDINKFFDNGGVVDEFDKPYEVY